MRTSVVKSRSKLCGIAIFPSALRCPIRLSSYLDELYTLLLLNIGYQQAVDFKRKLDALVEEILKVVWVSEAIEAEAWSVFEQFNADKQWSFTDCISYVVMKQHEMVEVFAFDHHFAQMGFARLP